MFEVRLCMKLRGFVLLVFAVQHTSSAELELIGSDASNATSTPEYRKGNYHPPKANNPKGIPAEMRAIVDYPYLVALLVNNSVGFYRNIQFLCAGTIISENYVITAANCVGSASVYTTFISAGSNVFGENYHKISIEDIILHPAYSSTIEYDVALLKTNGSINFTGAIQPIKLQEKYRPLEENSTVTVSGWGPRRSYTTYPNHVMVVNIPVANFYTCWDMWRKEYVEITKNMWCGAIYDMGSTDDWETDMGGPAVQKGALVGIVIGAHFQQNSSTLLPVFINIAAPAIRDFIKNNTGL